MAQPTQQEKLQEKLREVESRLARFKKHLGTSVEAVKLKLEKSEQNLAKARGEPRFVRIGTTMLEATDRLQFLLEVEESLTQLLEMEGKDPEKETEKLLARKVKLLKKLMRTS